MYLYFLQRCFRIRIRNRIRGQFLFPFLFLFGMEVLMFALQFLQQFEWTLQVSESMRQVYCWIGRLNDGY